MSPLATWGCIGRPNSVVAPQLEAEPDFPIIHTGPGRIDMLADGLLLDVRLSQLGLDEVTRQHFKIPVTGL